MGSLDLNQAQMQQHMNPQPIMAHPGGMGPRIGQTDMSNIDPHISYMQQQQQQGMQIHGNGNGNGGGGGRGGYGQMNEEM